MRLKRQRDCIISGTYPSFKFHGIPAIGICEVCERDVVLEHTFANTCKCGAEYDLCGWRLKPRNQWDKTPEEMEKSLDDVIHHRVPAPQKIIVDDVTPPPKIVADDDFDFDAFDELLRQNGRIS